MDEQQPHSIRWRRFNSFSSKGPIDDTQINWDATGGQPSYPEALEWMAKHWEAQLNHLAAESANAYDYQLLNRAAVSFTCGIPQHDLTYHIRPEPGFWQRLKNRLKIYISDWMQFAHDQLVETGCVYCACDCEY